MTIKFHSNNTLNNISLDDITHASQSGSTMNYAERLNIQLNKNIDVAQNLLLDEKLMEYGRRFREANSAVKGKMLQEVDRFLKILDQEVWNHIEIQDPSDVGARRTFGKRG